MNNCIYCGKRIKVECMVCAECCKSGDYCA